MIIDMTNHEDASNMPKNILHLTLKDVPELKGKTVGDECNLIVSGRIKSVTKQDKEILYVIEVEKVKYDTDGETQDKSSTRQMRKAYNKAEYVKLATQDVSL